MQTKVNSVVIHATNATGAGKTSTLKIGDKIIVTVTLSETVVVTGEPTYTISIGGVNKSAAYVSTASNANTLVFSYTIASGDTTTTGITATTTALSLNTGSIKDTAGNAIQLATPAVASSANTITVDAKAQNAVDSDPPTALLQEAQHGFVINGEVAGDYSGHSVSNAGDVNGDGLDDLIVGAYQADLSGKPDAGKSYIVFGKQDTDVINLSAIVAGTGGFVINGESAGDWSGCSVSNAGDVNGDGLDDLIVGAYQADPSGKSSAGKSYVVFGKQDTNAIELSAIAAGTGGFVINGESEGDWSGYSVSSAGDVNGDGLDDLIVGAYQADPSGKSSAGKSYVVFGKQGNTNAIELSTIAAGTSTDGFVINGESVDNFSGYSVSSAGDMNGDGLDDLIVSAYQADLSDKTEAGKSYVIFGKQDNTAINLSAIAAGTGGFVIKGESVGDYSGYSVSSAGDVNGDGLDDLIIGAIFADASGVSNAGKSYVVFGKQDNTTINLSAIVAGTGGFVINGKSRHDYSGFSVSSAGDVNGDGLDDLIVGAYQADPSSKSNAGKSYVVFGKQDTNAIELSAIAAGTGGFVISGESEGDWSGYSVSSAGDMNGDGLDDLIVGAQTADPNDKSSAGKSYVIFGKTDTGAVDLSKLGNESKYTIDYLGDENANTLTSTATNKDEIFVAGAGNDTLTGNGGMDVFNAGLGNDTIIINASNITALKQTGAGNRARVDGGGGIDTLKLEGAGLTLDLTKISNRRIQDIEVIDITGSGNNILKLNLDELLDASTSTNILKVLGDSGDKVYAAGFGDSTIDKTVNGITYDVYTHDDANTNVNAELWIQKGVMLKGIQRGFVINGESEDDFSALPVSSAGDVNGDGLDDLIIGAHQSDLSGKLATGKSYVVFGKTNSSAINLSAIADASNPTGGFVINGEAAYDWSGFSVSCAGDVNGDGLDDLIVGAWGSGQSDTGKSYVVFGKTNSSAINLSAIADASNPTGGFVINGEAASDYSGYSVSSAGDVNGDGLDDLIVGAWGASPSGQSDAGKSYVVFGKTNSSAINLSVIADASNPTGGFVINGEVANDYSGYSVSSAGDVNGDGLDDLIVGAYQAELSGKTLIGKSYVVFGKANSNAIDLSVIADASNPTGGFVINGETAYDYSGFSVSSAGDVNGDGLDDLIVGAKGGDLNNITNVGKSYVVFGKANSSAINLSAIADASNPLGGFVIHGETAGDFSGFSVSSAGDVNGDGLDDLIVGAWGAPSGQSTAGKSYVVFGKTNNSAVNLSAIADANTPTGGFVIHGEAWGDRSGFSVSSAGDVNGDGLDDLIVGAKYADLSDKPNAGKSYVIFGKTDTNAIDLAKLGGNSKYAIDHLGNENANTLTGTSNDEIFVAGAGDDTLTGNGGMDVFNAGSGKDSILINASNISALEQTGAGNRARVDGGGGVDTLKLDGAGLTLDLTKISNTRIQDIEIIDIRGSGNNTLKLNLNDLLDASTSTNILKVLGNSGDTVNTSGFVKTKIETENGITYDIYTHSDANIDAKAALWVQQGVSMKDMQRGFVINGETADDLVGMSISNAGDVNGDGLDDLIIGVNDDSNKEGKAYVIFGKQDGTAINLSTIASGIGGFLINSETMSDDRGSFGPSVSSAGDVNGDGLDDLILGAYTADPNGKLDAGKSYVVFGKANGSVVNLSDITSASNPLGGFVINGEAASDYSGSSVSSAGDVNGDGLDDLIVGASYADPSGKPGAGKSYIVFGKADSSAIDLSVIANASNPLGGFVINGGAAHEYSGCSVSSAGDVNGDGLDDLIVGAFFANSIAGKSYVVFGKANNSAIDLSVIADTNNPTGGFVINGEAAYDWSGWSVSSAGDVNGDGLDDLIVGASDADPSGKSKAGKSYVVFGKANSSAIDLSAIADVSNPTGGFVINGEAAGDVSGNSVSSAGDVNGDGLDDLIVGAVYADSNGNSSGKSYVIFGKANSSAINLSTIADASNPTGGFVINGEVAGDRSGSSVSSAGDVNGDGLDDLIVGAYGANPNGINSGKAYIIFGKTDTNAIDLAKLGGDSKYAIDYLGDKNANTLTGTSSDEIFVAGAGNDTLTGNGGMDVFNAGLGSDDIIINASNITALEQTGTGNRARVDGGGGTDTLKLEGADLTLDLTKISDRRIQDIEVIDITGSGENTLKLNLDDLLHASSSTNILKVLGDSDDKVNAAGFSDSTIDKTVDGITYDVYTHSDANTNADVELWVQQEIVMF